MYKGYKAKALIVGNRKRFLRRLVPQLVQNSHILDEIMIGVTFIDAENLLYVRYLKDNFKEANIKIVIPSTLNRYKHDGSFPYSSFWQFHQNTTENDTLYFKFDDDISFVEPRYFEKQGDALLKDEQHVFQYPMIVNNPICNFILNGKILERPMEKMLREMKDMNNDMISFWERHNTLLDSADFSKYRMNPFEFGSEYNGCASNDTSIHIRPSINALCYYGQTMKRVIDALYSVVKTSDYDDEQFMTYQALDFLKQKHVVCSDSLVVHCCFGGQRNQMSNDDLNQLLGRYEIFTSKCYPNIRFV